MDKTVSNTVIDHISYELYENIIQSIFKLSYKNDKRIEYFEVINDKYIELLFLWPLIIAKRYLFPYLELDLYKELFNLNYHIKNNCFEIESEKFLNLFSITDFSENVLSQNSTSLINPEFFESNFSDINDLCTKLSKQYTDTIDIEKYIKNHKEIPFSKFVDFLIGGKPNSRNKHSLVSSKLMKRTIFTILIEKIIGAEKNGEKIRSLIVFYYITLYIFLISLNKKSNCNELPGVNIKTILNYVENHINVGIKVNEFINYESLELTFAFGSYLFSDAINLLLYGYNEIFLKNKYPDLNEVKKYAFYKDDPYYYASFYCSDEQPYKYFVDVEREIVISKKFDYKLQFWCQKDLSNNEITDLIIFNGCDKNKYSNQLLQCLSQLAYKVSIQIYNYINKYNTFISNAEPTVDNQLAKFLERIDNIHNSYHLFNEYIEQKDFSRAIENLDMNLGYNCIEETRKVLKKKRKNHLSPELIINLLNANKELSILYSSIQRKHDAHKSNLAKQFFTENPQYFSIIEFDDIKNIDFSSNPNGIRDARRKIFYNIAHRRGKDVSGSKIAKELALE